jgi:hypothetical protein
MSGLFLHIYPCGLAPFFAKMIIITPGSLFLKTMDLLDWTRRIQHNRDVINRQNESSFIPQTLTGYLKYASEY